VLRCGKLGRNRCVRSRLDELPQLFHVLVGEMSLIGPRPLLPQDQPANSTLRLMVRPGITGWAQINGGNLVTTEEKGALDDWYVRRPSMSAFGGKADAPYAATKKAPADVVVASVLALTGCPRIGDCSVPA
jgi:Bacterial sugar transferase